MSGFPGADMNLENEYFLSLEDPPIHTPKEKFILGNVQKIVKGMLQ